MASGFEPVAFDVKSKVADLTSHMLHRHYGENDVESLIELFDDDFLWIGAGEEEYATGGETVASIFRTFTGKIPRCNISDEHYDVIEIAPDVYLCSGRLWVETDPSTGVFLRVHQRITTAFRLVDGKLRCCHIHNSNPYVEMVPGDVGFPTNMAQQSRDYLEERLAEQTRLLEDQAAELRSIYNTVTCALMRFLRVDGRYLLLTCNHATAEILGMRDEEVLTLDWSNGVCPRVMDEDAPELRDALERLSAPGDREDVICRVARPSGEMVYVNSVNLLVSADERGDIVQKVVFDVTEHMMTEEALRQKGFEDALTGLFNRSKFSHEMDEGAYRDAERLGIAYFDINGLKAMNDLHGHAAGDDLICRTARHIRSRFRGRTYRIGGDEFVVADTDLGEAEFKALIAEACDAMNRDGIRIAVGLSWRGGNCDFGKQFDEADKLMYEDKAAFYRGRGNDRRH